MFERLLHFSSTSHRWLTVVFALMVAALGAYAFTRLPIDAVPDITNNQVIVNTVDRSLSPIEIEKQVTFPIETALAGVPGLQYTRSLSRNGFSQVTAVFDDGVDVYFARQQVTERVNQAKENLRPGIEPKLGAITTGLGEIYMYAIEYEHPDGEGAPTNDGQPGWQRDGAYLTPEGQRLSTSLEKAAYLRTVQDWVIAPQLRTVKGVAGVDSLGGYEKQYMVQPDMMKLVSYGLTFDDLISALEKNNSNIGAGYIEHKGEAYTVRITGRIENAQQIGTIMVGGRNGTPVYIDDVATVGVGKELRTGTGSKDGHEAVIGTTLMRIGANSRTVSKAVDAKLVEINRLMPPDVRTKTVLNRTNLVNATILTVETNLAEGALLVLLILFLMLGNFRAALITALAIPMSMLMTAIGMVQAGISGNLMSLGAIDFGLVVDGAVIIVENCLRQLAEKQHLLGRKLDLKERLDVVFQASRQMIKPSAYGLAIIITVYLALLTLTGTEGKMFRPMGITVVFALTSAFILSLTLVPALVALTITGKVREKENLPLRWAKAAYAPLLGWAIRARWVVIGTTAAAFVASLFLFMRLGQEFTPTLDEKDLDVEVVRIPSTALSQTVLMQLDVEKAIGRLPEIATVFSKIGTGDMANDPMPMNAGDTYVMLKPREEWPDPRLPKSALIEKIDQIMSKLPGNQYTFSQPIQMRFNELIAGIKADVAAKVFGEEFERMTPVADSVARILQGIGGAADVKVEQTEGAPVMNIRIDRLAVARYGLNISDVQDVVAAAVGGRVSGQVFEGDRRFDLVVRLPDEVRHDRTALENLPIPLPKREREFRDTRLASAAPYSGNEDADISGENLTAFVPLSTVATIEVAEGPNQVSRENGMRRVVVQANVRGRDVGSFVAEAQTKINAQVKIPPGYYIQWGGQFENLLAARERLMIVVPACFFLIFLLLFSTFNSVRYALLVFTGVPLALTGGIVSLWLRDMPFSISAAVGFIALSGVAVLNGLVLVTFIRQLRHEGIPMQAAVSEGCLKRLRPVLMTAMVAALGFVPMALSTSMGAEVQRPLATVVIGGIVSSTLLTLVVLPAVYSWFAPKHEGVEIVEAKS
ncbi:MAG: CusA/CzcA family heavy metal efflux RND transporter [Planctomycetes bacterium]|nr:CusA/CzcA family heavy metal efflux RND transporter [Planctomycetota bacterium]MBI3835748.1 CusA/CzcA family heavy metal efflux RND transporter [Planctomycetota bacterium]